jgi:diguanylate cyclase (GGDEF)-like protein
VISGCDLATTARRSNQIRELIAGRTIPTPHGATALTVSMGVTVTELSTNSELLLHSADEALYQTKRNGRNRVEQIVSPASTSGTGT